MAILESTQFGKYLLLDRIGMGGMAELHRAKMLGEAGFEKLVAVKKLLPSSASESEVVEAFIHEAKLAALLHHQNIVQIYDFGHIGNAYFLSMEYLFGKDLQTLIKTARSQRITISKELALFIVARICEGLDYAHNMKAHDGTPLHIIHRDISPPNIFITYDGQVKIIDFGIAKAASKKVSTQDGLIKGKVHYMSPEQAQGLEMDHRSDIFSVGVVLYELITGARMFPGDTLTALKKVQALDYEPPARRIEGITPELQQVFDTVFVMDPDKRYQSSGEMYTGIEHCMQQFGYHPTARMLSGFMKALFNSQIASEKQTLSRIMKIEPGESVTIDSETGSNDAKKPETARGFKYRSIAIPLLILGALVTALFTGSFINSLFKSSGAPHPIQNVQEPKSVVSATAEKTEAGMRIQVPNLNKAEQERLFSNLSTAKKSLKKKDYATAVSRFRAIWEVSPDFRDNISIDYANALIGQAGSVSTQDPDQAEALLLSAIDMHPGSIDALFTLATLRLRNKRYPEAIQAYRKVLLLDESHHKAYFNLGFLYMMVDDLEKSETMYTAALEMAPDYQDEILVNLAIVLYKQGKRDACLERLNEAVKINPENNPARQMLTRLNSES
ncbi:MAG: hypothetical protein CSA22_01470 [Deltaproteobacteria bacterium]|nr:MAG: hypothetical protein CSA22_01470 [Deltaproteobacteria bacterium]